MSSSMSRGVIEMSDQHLDFLNKFLSQYSELILHNGHGDITISIRSAPRRMKEVRFLCGREYRYMVPVPTKRRDRLEYRVTSICREKKGNNDQERRSGSGRRSITPRRKSNIPRNFRLERRILVERRSGYGRRRND